MKTELNQPLGSKINWTALAVLAIGVANTAGWIPVAWRDLALEAATIVLPILIMLWRTKFTDPKPEMGP